MPASIHPGIAKNYPLEFLSPVRYVTTMLERAPMTVADLARGYRHPNPGDIERIKHHEHRDSNRDAVMFLIERVLLVLGDQVRQDQLGFYRLSVPFDDLRYDERPIARMVNDRRRFGDPFNPMTGARFSRGVRKTNRIDDDLRVSLATYGWLDFFPATVDERDVVIDGRKRMIIAESLGITPKTRVVRFGLGDAADAARMAYAHIANMGKPLTDTDLSQFADVVYGDKEWSMQRFLDVLLEVNPKLTTELITLTAEPDAPRKNNSNPSTTDIWGGPGITNEQAIQRRNEADELAADLKDIEKKSDAEIGDILRRRFNLQKAPVSGSVNSLVRRGRKRRMEQQLVLLGVDARPATIATYQRHVLRDPHGTPIGSGREALKFLGEALDDAVALAAYAEMLNPPPGKHKRPHSAPHELERLLARHPGCGYTYDAE